MRFVLLLALAAVLAAAPAPAQIINVTATGTTNSVSGNDFENVPIGAEFTFTFSFNAAAVTPGAFTGGYATPSSTVTLNVDGLTFSDDVGTGLVISSESSGGPFGPLYGYEIGTPSTLSETPIPNNMDFELFLFSTNSAVAPNTSLSSLQTSPVSDFYDHEFDLSILDSAATGASSNLFGYVTDFSVTTTAAPEPRAWLLLVLGVAAVGLLRWRSNRNAA